MSIYSEVPKIFAALFDYSNDYQHFHLMPDAIIDESQLYSELRSSGRTIKEALAVDIAAYKEKIKTVESDDEALSLSQQIMTKRLAVGANRKLDAVFHTLFSQE